MSGQTLLVADLSEAQGAVDWPRLPGAVDGVVLRLGYRGYGPAGTLVTDGRFAANWAGARAAGIPAGAYWLSQARTEDEARAEADYADGVLRAAGAAPGTLGLPLFLDSEWGEAAGGTGRADRLSPAQRTRCALALLGRLRALGWRTGLYTGVRWFREQLDGAAIRAAGHAIWIASVEHVPPPLAWDAWQYTWRGQLPGVGTAVDLSRFRRALLRTDEGGSDMANDAKPDCGCFDAGWAALRARLRAAPGADYSVAARAWAAADGLFTGAGTKPDGTPDYQWGDFVTREQLAVVLWRLMGGK